MREDNIKVTESICLCAMCEKGIHQGDQMADRFIYKLGELDFIELAHINCAKELPYEQALYWDFGQDRQWFNAECDYLLSTKSIRDVEQRRVREEAKLKHQRRDANRYQPNGAMAIALRDAGVAA